MIKNPVTLSKPMADALARLARAGGRDQLINYKSQTIAALVRRRMVRTTSGTPGVEPMVILTGLLEGGQED